MAISEIIDAMANETVLRGEREEQGSRTAISIERSDNVIDFGLSLETKEQMARFREWVISSGSREVSLADKGILYTLIGMADRGYTIGQVEEFVPDSNKSVHRHLRGLEAKGLVTLIPSGNGKQIAGMHYRVNL